jgi:uncharacterized protein YukJ
MRLSEPYGVWKGQIMTWRTIEARDPANSDRPHGYLIFFDDETPEHSRTWNKEREDKWKWYKRDKTHKDMEYVIPFRSSAINVKSATRDSRVVYWTGTLDRTNPREDELMTQLSDLSEMKFYEISNREEGRVNPDLAGLDFLRDNIINLADGTVRESNRPGENNDIIDALDGFFGDADLFDQTQVYIFGEYYKPKEDGLHNVHMNQGNILRRFKKENGPGQDGGIVIRNSAGQWKYFFTGFASQASETDEDGDATTNETLADIAQH